MKIVLLLFSTTILYSSTYEHSTLYKETKIMGMGGAGIATTGGVHSLFYNTAGLMDIPKENGWEVELLNIGVTYNEHIQDFAKDFSDASDIEDDNKQRIAMVDLTERYLNKNLHLSSSVALLKVGKQFESFALGVMPITGANINIKTHRGSGSQGLIEVNGMLYSGLAVGVAQNSGSKHIGKIKLENISMGVGMKYIKHKTISANLSLADLLDDNISDRFMDDYVNDGSDIVFDLGAKVDIYKNITVGASIQNIGDIAHNSYENMVPTTLNIGVAYKQKFDRVWFSSYEAAFDYTDILYQYQQDDDIIKRTRLGISGDMIGGKYGTISLQTGFHQGYNTFGFAIDSEIFKLAYAYYTSEIGVVSFQDGDKRHSIQFSIGW